MAKVLSDEEIFIIEVNLQGGIMDFAHDDQVAAMIHEDMQNLVATIRARDAELKALRETVYDVVVSSPYRNSFILTTQKLVELLKEGGAR